MIWQLGVDKIVPAEEVTFSAVGIKERSDLQRLLRDNIAVISPRTLIIAEEYGDWADSRCRVDLLGIDEEANLVVVELKRTEDGGHMELQAIRYAAMVSAMTFSKAVQTYDQHLKQLGRTEDAQTALLEFRDWEMPNENEFARDVRIVLASAEFSKELTTSVLWLNGRDLDVRCVRVKPYRIDGRILIDVQQVIPLPETAEYQVQLKHKAAEEKQDRESTVDFTRYDLTVGGQTDVRLWKRGLIYRVVRAAIEAGASPEDLARHFPRGASSWIVVPGTLSSTEFVESMRLLTGKMGASPKPNRYFVEDGELIHLGGRTYALTNQWSGGPVLETIAKIANEYPALGVSVSKTGSLADT